MTNIYVLRDRLIDYYMPPFPADNDKAVMAAVANVINNPGSQDAIAKAPHHYEIHRIAEINENAETTACKVFVCDCASLIRGGLRTDAQRRGQNPAPALAGAAGGEPGPHHSNGNGGGAYQHPVAATLDAEIGPPEAARHPHHRFDD